MPILLALETATEACSVALLKRQGQQQKLFTKFQVAPREHTKIILPMFDDVLAEAKLALNQIDAIAFGRGPGAFTGLRIAAGIAQGLALSVDKPVIPVSTLEALAYQAYEAENKAEIIIAALDARMDEVYWGVFKVVEVGIELIDVERVSAPEEMIKRVSGISVDSKKCKMIVIGSGWDVYHELLTEIAPTNVHHLKNVLPSAQAIAQVALADYENQAWVEIADAQPIYLRNKVAEKSKKA